MANSMHWSFGPKIFSMKFSSFSFVASRKTLATMLPPDAA
jgi:hypothetical protein